MPAPGDTLFHGRFRLRAPIGRGGAGTVWEADDVRDGGLVAVKLLPADAGGLAAAEREAEVAVRVKHPSAVRVALTFEEHGHAAVVMERCVASAADHVLVHGPLGPERAAQVMGGVLEALDAAHAVGVVHRDVKPANVLLRADGSVALGDWGIARALFGSGATHTTSVALLGTLPYMAPELRQDPRAASPASDVYAAGVTLAWLCTGTVPPDPFVAAGEAALRAALPSRVVEIVIRACAWEPAERFPRAREMAEALRQAVAEGAAEQGGPLRASAPAARRSGGVAGGGPPAPGGALRASAVAPILGAVAALVAAGASVWGVLRSGNEVAPPSATPSAGASTANDPSALAACPGAPSGFVERRERAPVETVGATAAHLDDDGRLDVVFSNQGAETLTVWWSSADGLPRDHEELAAGRVSGAVAAIDTDGDGQNDLVVPHKDEGVFTVRRGRGARAFEAPRRVMQGPAPAAVFPAGLGAIVFATDGGVYVRRVTPLGEWPPAVPIGGSAPLGTHTAAFVDGADVWVAAGDAEGRVDLRVASDDPARIRRRPLLEAARDGEVLPWIGADGVAVGLAALRDAVLLRVAPGDPCRVGAWRGGSPALLADLDADGVVDVVATLTCSGCTSNQILARGLP
jgi:hypothetical protein